MMNMSIEPWYAINDNVMGGFSSGGIALIDIRMIGNIVVFLRTEKKGVHHETTCLYRCSIHSV
jgi:hypothetical protein